MMDKFPEAFRRFERVVDIDRFDSFRELSYAFGQWAGKRWVDSYLQNKALKREGKRLGYEDVELPKYFQAKERREKWIKAVKSGKYRGVGEVRAKALNLYASKGYSANKIQKKMKEKGLGIQRKKLLKIVREMKMRPKKADAEKYTPKKYRKKRSEK